MESKSRVEPVVLVRPCEGEGRLSSGSPPKFTFEWNFPRYNCILPAPFITQQVFFTGVGEEQSCYFVRFSSNTIAKKHGEHLLSHLTPRMVTEAKHGTAWSTWPSPGPPHPGLLHPRHLPHRHHHLHVEQLDQGRRGDHHLALHRA